MGLKNESEDILIWVSVIACQTNYYIIKLNKLLESESSLNADICGQNRDSDVASLFQLTKNKDSLHRPWSKQVSAEKFCCAFGMSVILLS